MMRGDSMPMPDEKTIVDAYTYLLGRMLVIRQEHMDKKGDGFAYNAIKYNRLGSADFVNPNLDVAYLEAWIVVDADTPALLEVPPIMGRYYTAQLLDEWGEVIVNINDRTFPSKPCGKFALVAPRSRAKTPDDAGRIVLHSHKAKMLSRVELKDDPDGAVKLQQAFTLRSLGTPEIEAPPAEALQPEQPFTPADGVRRLLRSQPTGRQGVELGSIGRRWRLRSAVPLLRPGETAVREDLAAAGHQEDLGRPMP